jgi:hypothetical protein
MPASSQALVFIQEEVNQSAQGTSMFTLFDISRRVQTRLENSHLPIERHANLRDDVEAVVHQTLDHNWDRTINVPMQGRPGISATVYHRVGTLARDYGKPTASQVIAQFTPTINASSFAAVNGSNGVTGGILPNKAELRIPKHIVTQMGLTAGETLFVIKETNSNRLRLSKTTQLLPNTPGDCIATVTPDGRNELRLTRTLVQNNIGGVSYDIEAQNGHIIIRVHT